MISQEYNYDAGILEKRQVDIRQVAPEESDKLCLNRRTYAAADLNPKSIFYHKIL
jgi:hypothetical protein